MNKNFWWRLVVEFEFELNFRLIDQLKTESIKKANSFFQGKRINNQ